MEVGLTRSARVDARGRKVAESGVLSSEKVSLMGVRRELDDEDTERVGEEATTRVPESKEARP